MHACALALVAAALASGGPLPLRAPEGEVLAFPALLDEHGRPLATSTMRQWLEAGRLHVLLTHDFPDGRRVVERARFAPGSALVQEAWSWEERRDGRVVRAFEVDLVAGRARGRKVEGDGAKTWDEAVKVERGATFVGVGVTYAVKHLRDRLVRGEEVSLRGIAFLPKPVSLPLQVRHAGRERLTLAGRAVDADRFEVRPDLAGLEKVVELVKGPVGADVWLHHGTPPMLLRVRFPLAEASDPRVVVETLGAPRTPARARRPPARRGR